MTHEDKKLVQERMIEVIQDKYDEIFDDDCDLAIGIWSDPEWDEEYSLIIAKLQPGQIKQVRKFITSLSQEQEPESTH